MFVLVGLVAGCGDDEVAAACGEPAEDYVIDAEAVGHTCEHVTDGPFADVTASSPDAIDGPLLENEHMLYTIALVDDGSGSYAGAVTFRPAFSSTYVVNLSEELPVEVSAADDRSEPCNAASQSLPNCQGLVHAELYTLEAKRTYTVSIGPATSATVRAVVEEHIISVN